MELISWPHVEKTETQKMIKVQTPPDLMWERWSAVYSTEADFTKGLKSRFRLKLKTLVLNFVKRMLSLWS